MQDALSVQRFLAWGQDETLLLSGFWRDVGQKVA